MKLTGTITGRWSGKSWLVDKLAKAATDHEFYILVPTRFSELVQEIIDNTVAEVTSISAIGVGNDLSLFTGFEHESGQWLGIPLFDLKVPLIYATKQNISPKDKRLGYLFGEFIKGEYRVERICLTPGYNIGKQVYNQNKHRDWAGQTKQALRLKTRQLITGGTNV